VYRAGGLFQAQANGAGIAGVGYVGTMCTAFSAHFVVVSISNLNRTRIYFYQNKII